MGLASVAINEALRRVGIEFLSNGEALPGRDGFYISSNNTRILYFHREPGLIEVETKLEDEPNYQLLKAFEPFCEWRAFDYAIRIHHVIDRCTLDRIESEPYLELLLDTERYPRSISWCIGLLLVGIRTDLKPLAEAIIGCPRLILDTSLGAFDNDLFLC